MSNETKRDVFNAVLDAYDDALLGGEGISNDTGYDYIDRYSAALPDDLPTIPEAVGQYIQKRKAAHDSLAFALTARFIPNEVVEWMFMVAGDPDTELSQIEYAKQQDTLALAWVLGVWCVEETGEIVKLEAEVQDETN